jgi:hypothetical protein
LRCFAEVGDDGEDTPIVFVAGADVELGEDAGDVGLDRAFAEVEAIRDGDCLSSTINVRVLSRRRSR